MKTIVWLILGTLNYLCSRTDLDLGDKCSYVLPYIVQAIGSQSRIPKRAEEIEGVKR